ncbi:HelD family protein [Streptomyces yaizuensis]
MADAADDQVRTGEHAFASGADAEVLGRHLRGRARELREEPEGPAFFGRIDFARDGPPGAAGPPPYGEIGTGTAAPTGSPTDGPATGEIGTESRTGRPATGEIGTESRTGRPETGEIGTESRTGRPETAGPGTAAPAPDGHQGQSYHIGRRRIAADPLAPPLVIDWRAPVARAFYQATARDPLGLAVRRRFGWARTAPDGGHELTGLEDEHLARDGGAPAGFLAEEIERPRVGPMRDIAATLQPEQDDIVRSGPAVSLCVQGAPGTGKTAVGLHRAAYLLYTHPQRFHRTGLLVIGPNRAFLAYISEVLPALGERSVRQSTLEDEIARHAVRARDTPAAAAVKHDIRMAGVLRRALYARVVPPAGGITVPDGSHRWRVPHAELERIVAGVRAEDLPYAVGRERVRGRVVRVVRDLAERRSGPRGEGWIRRTGRTRAVTALLDAVWPPARPEEVLAAVLTDPADDALAPHERAAVRWAVPPRSYRTARWTAADLVLLDEVAGLIERPAGYGHVVVDEAQDLSPMQCRAIARRSVSGSLTVLGDLAQGTTPWAARDWAGLLAHLGRADAPVIPLTSGHRVPEAVLELAGRLLVRIGAGVPAVRSVRRGGEVTVRRADDLVPAVVGAVRSALERPGSVGVIADGRAVGDLYEALAAGGVAAARLGDPDDSEDAEHAEDAEDAEGTDALGARVTVLPATAAKGLEYDHVVAVEPAAIVAAEDRGHQRLYTVLTRAVSRLDVLHRLPLPAALERPPAPARVRR